MFHYLHILSPESVLLPFRHCLPFWYLLLFRLVLSCCSPLLYPDWNSFAGLSFPLTESPPASIDAGSLSHWLYLHRYYEFFRRLIMHWSDFPVQVISRLPRIFSTDSIDPETCRVCFQLQGGHYETSLGRTGERLLPSRP